MTALRRARKPRSADANRDGGSEKARRSRRHGYDRADADARPSADDGSSAPVSPVCDACPVGWIVGAWRSAEPEAVDHLLTASHEFLGAIRVIVDAADAAVEEQRKRRAAGNGRVRRIDVE